MRILYQSQTIIIREFMPGEELLLIDLFNDDEVTRYLPACSPELSVKMFNTALEDYNKGLLSRWGIFSSENNNFIGMCLARNFTENPDQIEIGYTLSKKYWGKGIATEVNIALTKYCFANTGTQEVVAITDLGNVGSQKVLEKLGFKRLENLIRNEDELAYFMIER
ncbi:anhydro-N-acetylmuramic acid kinase [compost metagenome]